MKSIQSKLLYIIIAGLLLFMLAGNIAYAAGKPAISKTAVNLLVGKTYSLTIKNKPAKATYAWISSNKKIATVSKSGQVKGIAKGTATITCTVKASGKTYSLKSKVQVIYPAKAVTVPDKDIQLKAGESAKLSYKLSPASSNDKITWSTDNKEAVTVDSTGRVTANKVGIAHITAAALSGKKAIISVAVYDDIILNISIDDVDQDGNIAIKDQVISNIYIENSARNAQITLDNVIITGKLTMEAGTDYTVKADNSVIASAEIVTPKDPSTVKDNESPTLQADDKSGVWEVTLRASSAEKDADGPNIQFCISAETGTLIIDKSLKKADIVVTNKVNKLVNNGADIGFTLAEGAYVSELIDNKNSDGEYGNYSFGNTPAGNFTFTAQVGDMLLEGIQMKDFIDVLNMIEQMWPDKTKPFIIPQEEGTTITYIGDNTYEFNFSGKVFTLTIDEKAGAMTVKGSDILKITDIQLAK